MDKEMKIFIVSCSVITAFLGLFFVFKIWLVWKQVDKVVLKARVFLNNNFLVKNWIYVFFAGAFIAERRVMELLELLGIPAKSWGMGYLFDIMGFFVIVLLVLLAYHWYRLVYSTIPSKESRSGSLKKTI